MSEQLNPTPLSIVWQHSMESSQKPSSTSASVTFLQFNPTSTTDVGRGMPSTLSALIASVAVEFTTLAQHCTGPAAHSAVGVAVAVAVGVAQALEPDGPILDLCASTTARNGSSVTILSKSEVDGMAELCGAQTKELRS